MISKKVLAMAIAAVALNLVLLYVAVLIVKVAWWGW